MEPKIKIQRKGDYIHAFDMDGGYVCATYSKRTKKIWGQTRCFFALRKAIMRK